MMSISPPRGQSTVAEKDQLSAISILPGLLDRLNVQSRPCSTDATRHMEEVANNQTLIVESVAGNSDALPAGAVGLELARVVTVIVSHGHAPREAKDYHLHSDVSWAVAGIDETIACCCGLIDVLHAVACQWLFRESVVS
jgi:hypothetical protein